MIIMQLTENRMKRTHQFDWIWDLKIKPTFFQPDWQKDRVKPLEFTIGNVIEIYGDFPKEMLQDFIHGIRYEYY